MKSLFEQDGPRLVRRFGAEQLWIEPWGANSLRVRVTHRSTMETEDWALLAPADSVGSISIGERGATIRNGRIEAIVTDDGRIEFVDRHGTTLLREYVRRRDTADPPRSPLKVRGREFRSLLGGEYELTVRFESNQSERIFGMGQYQHEFLDLKGCTLELAQRNSQASVPFAVSSLGYGFLWNNPAIGRVTFAKNVTEWHASVSRQLDYWVTAGDRPADIVEAYALATGTVPLMPEWATGLWQSKLRYQTQEELLAIAREHTRRGLPLTVIAADFFHWRKQGDWAFDWSASAPAAERHEMSPSSTRAESDSRPSGPTVDLHTDAIILREGPGAVCSSYCVDLLVSGVAVPTAAPSRVTSASMCTPTPTASEAVAVHGPAHRISRGARRHHGASEPRDGARARRAEAKARETSPPRREGSRRTPQRTLLAAHRARRLRRGQGSRLRARNRGRGGRRRW